MHANIRLAGELGTALGNFASVFGIKDLLQSVVQIGGQLENQRIALGAILQDGGKATEMFSRIQSLAVKSPFGIMDLNQYAKQLSAYSVPYNELYDTMKRLADISAGVGVDMGRIILAFGQVKAAGFLKGTELRQFTEANIPMVAELAKKFTELEGKIISAGEVYDMISKKKITFEDVKSVLWKLTDEGGMFNNMQEVLSESLASKWKNLSDAVDVMFGKIADGTIGNGLKAMAEGLTELTKGWKYVATAIGSALATFTLYKTAVVLGSKQMSQAKGTYGFLLHNKQQEAAMLKQEGLYRRLTKAELELIRTSTTLTNADVKKAVSTGMLNKKDALRLITLGKLDKAMLRGVQRTLQISNAEIAAARNATWLNRAWASLSMTARSLGAALKGLFLNPWTLTLAAISAVGEGITYLMNKSSESNQRIKDAADAAASGYNNLKEAVKSFADAPTTEGGMISVMNDMNSKLKDYAANWAEIFKEVYAKNDEGDYILDVAERYELLNQRLNETKEAYKLIATEMEGFMEAANKSTDGYFDESFRDNLLDASEAMGEYKKALNEVTMNTVLYEDAMQKAIENDAAFAEAAKGKSFREQVAMMYEYSDAFKEFTKNVGSLKGRQVFSDYMYYLRYLKEEQKIALEDAKQFTESYKKLLEGRGWDLNNLTKAQEFAIGANFKQYFDAIEGLDEETKKLFLQETVEKAFNIKLTTEFNEEPDLEKWKKELIKAAGGEELQAEVKATIKASVDYESMVEAVREMYKDAKTIANDLKPVLLKVGITADGLNEIELHEGTDGLDPETFKALTEYNKAVRQLNAAMNIAKDQGFSLEKDKDGNKKDAVAEMWKKRSEEIEKAVKIYDQWKKVEGKLFAENRVKYNEELSNLFSGAYGFKLDLENPTEAYEYIREQLDEAKEKQKELKVNLGVKISDAELKDAQDELKDFLENTQKYIDKTTKDWQLYKKLFEATGDKNVSMNIAFGGKNVFENQLIELKNKILSIRDKIGSTISFDELITKDTKYLEENKLGGLANLIKAYNDESQRLKKESIENFIDIINSSKDFAQQITDIDRKLQKDLADLRSVGSESGMSEAEINRRAAELTQRAEEDKTKVRFEEFKKSSDWVKVFDDLDRVSSGTLDNMIAKIEEFARQGKLSEEVTKQLVEAMGKLRDESIERNPFKGFSDALARLKNFKALQSRVGEYDENGKLITQQMVDDGIAEANEDLKDSTLAIADKFQAVADAANMLSGLFQGLGIDVGGFVDVISGTVSGAQSGAGIASAFGIAGPWGAVAGAAVGMLSSVFAMHDKALQAEIEASEAREKMIKSIADLLTTQFERNLGGVYTMKLSEDSKKMLQSIQSTSYLSFMDAVHGRKPYSEETRETAKKALEQDSYYLAQLASLQAQRDEMSRQREAEIDKKDTDQSKVQDYEDEIRQMTDEIDNFAREMVDTLYGIDFKDWASQLSESLVEAWANGEDAVLAYKNTVTDILRDLGVSVITQKIIEPLLNNTVDAFLKQFDADKGILTNESMSILAGLYDGAEKASDAAKAYLEGLKKLGIDLSETGEGSGGLSKDIKGVTEDTASLLASYINAIRASVDVKRSLIEKLIGEDVPKMNYIAEAQLIELRYVVENTKRNADAADKIYDLVNRVVDKGSNKLKI